MTGPHHIEHGCDRCTSDGQLEYRQAWSSFENTRFGDYGFHRPLVRTIEARQLVSFPGMSPSWLVGIGLSFGWASPDAPPAATTIPASRTLMAIGLVAEWEYARNLGDGILVRMGSGIGIRSTAFMEGRRAEHRDDPRLSSELTIPMRFSVEVPLVPGWMGIGAATTWDLFHMRDVGVGLGAFISFHGDRLGTANPVP